MKKTTKSRPNQILNTTLYCYVRETNALFAKEKGKNPKYGSYSSYIDSLISKVRGIPPVSGTRGTKGKPRKIVKHYTGRGYAV